MNTRGANRAKVVMVSLWAVFWVTAGLHAQEAEPVKPSDGEIKALVEKLSSDSFGERQRAVKRLSEIGEPALAMVTKAAAGGDPETAMLAKKIREAVALSRMIPIDLAPYANQSLAKEFGAVPNNTLAPLPRGPQKFGGLPFTVGEKMMLLGSDRILDRPRKFEGIKIGGKYATLRILHGTAYGSAQKVEDGDPVAKYVVHYTDESKAEIPVVFGIDVRDWWNEDGSRPTARGKVVWEGVNAVVARSGTTLRLYAAAWENPNPEKEIATIDYIGLHDIAAPFCIAITAIPGAEPAKTAGEKD